MPKIAFIGAGSIGFTRGLVRDILSFPSLSGSTIALMDIDEERLAFIKAAIDKIVEAGNYPFFKAGWMYFEMISRYQRNMA